MFCRENVERVIRFQRSGREELGHERERDDHQDSSTCCSAPGGCPGGVTARDRVRSEDRSKKRTCAQMDAGGARQVRLPVRCKHNKACFILLWLKKRLQLALACLSIMRQPLLFRLFIAAAYTLAVLVPLSAQFVIPATPIFSWLLLFYSSQFIPKTWRPHIWVSVLPTLESVLYGANISDILTRYTHWTLDIAAWIPYGVVHFAAPFMVAAAVFVFAPPGAVKFWGSAFGWLNVVGVSIQIIFPCAPPCECLATFSLESISDPREKGYELVHGLIPATYDMKGSPGGLARIDALFHGNGYTKTFTGAPVPFGAFPSLHAGCATMEALFLSHFFPQGRIFYWFYASWLYWSTMVSLRSLLALQRAFMLRLRSSI